MLQRSVLPILDRELGPEGYELHLIGHTKGAPAEILALAARRPHIKIRGFVEPIDEDLWSGEVVLALNPIPLGNRVRIATAFAFGCCVVSHAANQAGMPALRHGDNALLAADGPGIARALIQTLRDPALRGRLGEGARRTFEQEYASSVCRRIEAILERASAGSQAVSAAAAAPWPVAAGMGQA